MQIHVIRPGDSLWGLSRAYNTTVEAISSANEIEDPNSLVIGQALVIPITGSFYWVSPGDSLYTISQRVNVPVEELARVNNIQNPSQLQVGMRLYIPPKSKSTKEVAAYIDTQTTGAETGNVVNEIGSYLTYLNVFSYSVNEDGSLNPPKDELALEASLNNSIAPLMVVTNFQDGTFSKDLATIILSDETLQNALFNNALSIMEEKGYKGIDFDFEYLGRENRERYNNFVSRAVEFFRPRGYFISSALAPKLTTEQIGTLYEGHDYAYHGSVLDFIFLMTYEWGWSGGADHGL